MCNTSNIVPKGGVPEQRAFRIIKWTEDELQIKRTTKLLGLHAILKNPSLMNKALREEMVAATCPNRLIVSIWDT